MKERINLFISYYRCDDPKRQQEIDHCLGQNIDNPEIDSIYTFIDDGSELPFESDKLVIERTSDRLKYRDWLCYIRDNALSGICLLANSDMYFDGSLALTREILALPDRFLALSRWEVTDGEPLMHQSPHWSQDVWGINASSAIDDSLLDNLNFYMGIPRCDNKVAYVFSIHGWKLYNPCRFLRSFHLHQTNLRSYDKKYDQSLIGGVAYVHPTAEPLEDSCVDIDVWVLRANQTRLSSINSTLEKWRKEKFKQADTYYDFAGSIGEPISLQEMDIAVNQGVNLFTHGSIYEIYRYGDELYFKDQLKKRYYKRAVSYTQSEPRQLVSCFFPSLLSDHVHEVRDLPRDQGDVNFWQYPCTTEKQAYLNHRRIEGFNTYHDRQLHLYVPVPWATYIDRAEFPDDYIGRLRDSIFWYKNLAEIYDVNLSVHTVCQHIHWHRMLEYAKRIGITDLHLSHKDSRSEARQQEQGFSFTLHGWPLLAVNYAVGERSLGLERKLFKDKTVLASFIGAHMPHYLNDSRIQVLRAAKEKPRPDVIIDLVDEWHFNKTVYQEQVKQTPLDDTHLTQQRERMIKYNSVLSRSKFSLCPVGSGPNTLRLWESIAVGSIPVLFSRDLALFEEMNAGKELLDNCVVWDSPIDATLFEHLQALPVEEMEQKRLNLLELYNRFDRATCFTV